MNLTEPMEHKLVEFLCLNRSTRDQLTLANLHAVGLLKRGQRHLHSGFVYERNELTLPMAERVVRKREAEITAIALGHVEDECRCWACLGMFWLRTRELREQQRAIEQVAGMLMEQGDEQAAARVMKLEPGKPEALERYAARLRAASTGVAS